MTEIAFWGLCSVMTFGFAFFLRSIATNKVPRWELEKEKISVSCDLFQLTARFGQFYYPSLQL